MVDGETWNALIAQFPAPSFLQTYEWGQVKARYGWQPFYLVWDADGKLREEGSLSHSNVSPSAAALILKKSIRLGGMSARLSILYTPKGPLLDWTNERLRERVLDDLQAFARRQGAIFLKMDPDVVLGTGVPHSEEDVINENGQAVVTLLNRRGWRYSPDQVQFKNTVLIDLEGTEAEWLARMKQKTRYNIRLAERKGVTLRTGTSGDFNLLYTMYAETSVRDGFVIREESYYRTVWELFTANAQFPTAEPIIAEVGGEAVAAIFVFYFAGRAYYVYGMSRAAHREKMPTYLLQWEAMKRARARGCTVYDLWGAPDIFDERDSMWGVYRFKEGLGGKVVRTLGAWDFAPSLFWYRLYSEFIPHLLNMMRSRGKKRTRRALGGARMSTCYLFTPTRFKELP